MSDDEKVIPLELRRRFDFGTHARGVVEKALHELKRDGEYIGAIVLLTKGNEEVYWDVSDDCGHYSVLGAMEVIKSHLVEIINDDLEVEE